MIYFRSAFRFASKKYFYDNKYLNLSLYSDSQVGSLTKISKIFTDFGVNMTFVKTQSGSSCFKGEKDVLNISIPKIPDSRLS